MISISSSVYRLTMAFFSTTSIQKQSPHFGTCHVKSPLFSCKPTPHSLGGSADWDDGSQVDAFELCLARMRVYRALCFRRLLQLEPEQSALEEHWVRDKQLNALHVRAHAHAAHVLHGFNTRKRPHAVRNVTQVKTRDIWFGLPRTPRVLQTSRALMSSHSNPDHFTCPLQRASRASTSSSSFFASARCRSTLSSMTCSHSSTTRSTLSSAIVSASSELHTRQRGTVKVVHLL